LHLSIPFNPFYFTSGCSSSEHVTVLSHEISGKVSSLLSGKFSSLRKKGLCEARDLFLSFHLSGCHVWASHYIGIAYSIGGHCGKIGTKKKASVPKMMEFQKQID
jgi:hypothetical protein